MCFKIILASCNLIALVNKYIIMSTVLFLVQDSEVLKILLVYGFQLINNDEVDC